MEKVYRVSQSDPSFIVSPAEKEKKDPVPGLVLFHYISITN